MTYYVIKFVWKDFNNFIQTTYAGYESVYHNWWPSPHCDFYGAAKNFYEKQSNYFKIITYMENSSTYISKIVINTEDVEKI